MLFKWLFMSCCVCCVYGILTGNLVVAALSKNSFWHVAGTAKSRTKKWSVIFQNFINEHNLWGTTAVLALSVHATVENNNLEFLLFSCRLSPHPPPHRSSFSISHILFNVFVSFTFFFFSPGNQQQLEVKVLDFWYSTDKSINKPLI